MELFFIESDENWEIKKSWFEGKPPKQNYGQTKQNYGNFVNQAKFQSKKMRSEEPFEKLLEQKKRKTHKHFQNFQMQFLFKD